MINPMTERFIFRATPKDILLLQRLAAKEGVSAAAWIRGKIREDDRP